MSSNTSANSLLIKELATKHGFMGAGIARAEHMDEEASHLEQWLNQGYHGEMAYMANHFDLRVDPTRLVPGAKSVISLLYNYFPAQPLNPLKGTFNEITQTPPLKEGRRLQEDESVSTEDEAKAKAQVIESQELTTHNSQLTKMNITSVAAKPTDEETFKISRYAYGEDYHKVVRRKLKALVSDMKKELGDFHSRVFVDSAPVLERDWAKRSGQGWVGKNTLLIHPKKGSYFFLAEIILDLELDYDHPIRDHCGTCTKCIDACPTDAISSEGYILDGSKCISYLTIELKSQIPESFKDQMEGWIFGCDICQEVCPWNRFSTPHHEPDFEQSDKLERMRRMDWKEMTEEIFDGLFSKSPVKRAGYDKLIKTIQFHDNK